MYSYSKVLTMTGGNVTFKGESTIKTTVDGNDLGNLVAGAGVTKHNC